MPEDTARPVEPAPAARRAAVRQRPLPVGALRAFEAVARHLSFRAAGEELHLTQSAVSRQIQSLEEEVGARLLVRASRHVALSSAGMILLRALKPSLERIDAAVQQIRQTQARPRVSISTFASFASLWVIPRLEAFQRSHPGLDIRITASDAILDLDDPELDLALRYCHPSDAPPGAIRLFGEVLSPAVSPWLLRQIERGDLPPLSSPADLAGHTLLEEDDGRAIFQPLIWAGWLQAHELPELQPQRWLLFNYTYQQVQAALAGQGVTLARLPLIVGELSRGDLVEPFGPAGRMPIERAYWLVLAPGAAARPEVAQLCDWVVAQAREVRLAMGESAQA